MIRTCAMRLTDFRNNKELHNSTKNPCEHCFGEVECIVAKYSSRPIVGSNTCDERPLAPNLICWRWRREYTNATSWWISEERRLGCKTIEKGSILVNCFWKRWRKSYLMSLQESRNGIIPDGTFKREISFCWRIWYDCAQLMEICASRRGGGA